MPTTNGFEQPYVRIFVGDLLQSLRIFVEGIQERFAALQQGEEPDLRETEGVKVTIEVNGEERDATIQFVTFDIGFRPKQTIASYKEPGAFQERFVIVDHQLGESPTVRQVIYMDWQIHEMFNL